MTNNKFYNEKAILYVYIANLEEYVKGNLVGDLISLPIEKNDWKDFLKTNGNPEEIAIPDYENNLGLDGWKDFLKTIGNPEEIAIHDYENNLGLDDWKDFLKTIGNPEEIEIHDFDDNLGLKGMEVTQYMSLKKLNELGERMGKIDPSEVDTFNALYEAWGNFEEALECFESDAYVFYGNMTLEEIAQEYIEECSDLPIYFRNHIDYQSIARDMRYDSCYYETDYGIIAIF